MRRSSCCSGSPSSTCCGAPTPSATGRRLLGAGVLLGLGLLTKTTLVYLAPLLVVVAARHAWHGRSRIALYGAVAWRRLGREERVPLAVLSATLVVLAATWVYAASDFLL